MVTSIFSVLIPLSTCFYPHSCMVGLLTRQVRGFCADLSNEDIFERVNVRGDIRFSDIHHNYFGMYVLLRAASLAGVSLWACTRKFLMISYVRWRAAPI